jgi:hypothetical protein
MTPFPPIERWLIPVAACEQTRNAVLPAGRRGNETGVFWLGERSAVSSVTAIVKPIGPGVVELPWQWSVAPEVYAAVAVWAKPRGLTLLAAVHTHLSAQGPQLSHTDRTQGLKVPDALAVIVRAGGQDPDPRRWGWFVFSGDDYRTVAGRELKARVMFTDDAADYIEISVEGAR